MITAQVFGATGSAVIAPDRVADYIYASATVPEAQLRKMLGNEYCDDFQKLRDRLANHIKLNGSLTCLVRFVSPDPKSPKDHRDNIIVEFLLSVS